MIQTLSGSTFVRPPGSPIYPPSGPSLVLPRRASPSIRSQRLPVDSSDASTVEARRQIAQVIALIRAAELIDEPRAAHDTQSEELAQSLQQLEAKLVERERAVEERECRLADRLRDLAESEILLEAREALVAASRKKRPTRRVLSDEERTALAALKAELDRQEVLLVEQRDALREREKFINESEARLFQKVQEQQEKENELEQREEDLGTVEKPHAGMDAAGPAVTERVFDEFRE